MACNEPGERPAFVHQAGTAPRTRRGAEPGEVEGDHTPEAREAGSNLEPVDVRAPEPMDEHERRVPRSFPLPEGDRPVDVCGVQFGQIEAHLDRLPAPTDPPR